MSDHSPHCNELDRPAVVAPAERGVRPRAWAAFTPCGNIRVWTSAPEDVMKLAASVGVELTPLYALTDCPTAIMDTRDALGLCAPTEQDFPALYALQGRRVALVDLGPNGAGNRPAVAGPVEWRG